MKNKTIAFFLALFVGSIGAHKFYLGDKQKGLLYLIFFWTYIPFVLGIFEAIKIIKMTDDEFYAYQSTYLNYKEEEKNTIQDQWGALKKSFNMVGRFNTYVNAKRIELNKEKRQLEELKKQRRKEKRRRQELAEQRKWDREKKEFKFVDPISVAVVLGENLIAYNYKGKRAFKVSKSARENAYDGFYAIGQINSRWRKVPDAYLVSFNNESFKDNMSKLGYDNLEWIIDLGMKYIEFQKDERVNLFEKDIKDKAARNARLAVSKAAEVKRISATKAAEVKQKAAAKAAEVKRKAAAKAAEVKRKALKKELIEKYGEELGLAIYGGELKIGMTREMVKKCDQLSSRGPTLKKDNEWYYNKTTASFGFDTILKFKGDILDKVINPKDADGIWLDMTKKELTLACGKPEKKGNKNVSRTKVTEVWKYFGRINRQKKVSYRWEVRLVNDIVEGWKELE